MNTTTEKHTIGSTFGAVLRMIAAGANAGATTMEGVELYADAAKDTAIATKATSSVFKIDKQIDEAVKMAELGNKISELKAENKSNKALLSQLDSLL